MKFNWFDDNHVKVIDDNREFDVTVHLKEFKPGRKSRAYVNGSLVREKEKELGYRKSITWAKEYFKPVLSRILLKDDIQMKFSRTAGCQCGCSPGFIIETSDDIPFDVWITTEK